MPPGVTDTDSDGDLLPDSIERAIKDSVSFNAWLNTDSDMDGINDLIESGLLAANQDTDSDGIDDAFDSDANGDGFLDAERLDQDGNQVADGLTARIRDTDGDGVVDMFDLDSDNDGISDQVEGRADYDQDGIEDYIDRDPPIEVAEKGAGAISIVSLLLILLLRLRRSVIAVLLMGLCSSMSMASPWDRCLDYNEASLFVGKSQLEPDPSGAFFISESEASGVKAQLACQVYPRLYAEFFYSDLGEATVGHLNPALNLDEALGYQAMGLSARYRYGLMDSRLGVYGRTGLAVVNAKSGGPVTVNEDSAPKIMLGLGMDWFITPKWSVELAYDSYSEDAQLAMIGLSYQLGQAKAYSRQEQAYSQDLLVEDPLASAAEEAYVRPDYGLPEIEIYFDEDKEWVKPAATELANTELKAPNLKEVLSVLSADPFIPLTRNEVKKDSCERYQVQGMEPSVSIGFAIDSAGMNYESMERLQHFAGCLSYHIEGTLIIEGHTDETASSQYNLKLSNQRAATVKAFLLKLGMSAKRISDVGLGETSLKSNKATELGHAHNRRVEIYLR